MLQDLANTFRQEVHTELNPEGAGSREEEGKVGEEQVLIRKYSTIIQDLIPWQGTQEMVLTYFNDGF